MSNPKSHQRRSSKSNNPSQGGPQILSFPLEKRAKATRASLPKVRTGCITCKRRHVKCDEAKPSCERCIRWRGFCDGYDIPTGSSRSREGSEPESDPGPRTHASRTNSSSTVTTQDIDMPIDPQLEHAITDDSAGARSTSMPASLNDTRKVGRPSGEHSPPKGGMLDDMFWTEHIPHILRDRPDVLYANLAIHAIGLSKRPETTLLGRFYNGEAMRQRAFAYYGEALRCVSLAPVSTEEVRRAIACSLFFIVFEMYNDDLEAAQAHFRSGQRMADELYKTSDPEDESFRAGALDMGWELHNVLCFLKTQERTSNLDRWRNGFECVGEDWLGKDWTGIDSWMEETPLLEFAMVKLAPARQTEGKAE